MPPDEVRAAARHKVLEYGRRMLAKNPGFTAVAVISPAIGVGAGSASVLRMVLRQGLVLVLALYGLGAGLVLSYGSYRLLQAV
jgi:hypothetical protein